ncbi:hypothetical protein B842_00670 [Corynebacterium humireducens NBRC 106098 = DSM 45392]|uniref:Secreted protein n=2 Tax=Corynebacterium humireducens TaxID=1223514 RepID=A0A0B5CZQ4_9CORY|nr:hypothetical protein B842_00670 [Corynebacterium humireducens NBRC 106098 = DSM 45392]
MFGVTAVILLLPAALLLVVPTRDVSERVELGLSQYDWTIPLEMECRPSTDVLVKGWTCGPVLMQTLITEGGTDPDRTLRRMMRALVFGPVSEDAEMLREGDARIIIDQTNRAVGISLEGTGENRGLTMVALLSGPGEHLAPLSDTIWREFTGNALSAGAQEAIASTSGDRDGGLRLPIELTQVMAE